MASNCTGLLVAIACLPLAACLEGAGTIQGQLRAPAGTRVLVASDLGDTQDVSVPTDAPYGVANFELPAVVSDGTEYTVTVDDVPESHACSVYGGGTGTTPAIQVRVGCEIVEDLVSRSSDNAVLGTAFESASPVISSDGRFSALYRPRASTGPAAGIARSSGETASAARRSSSARGPRATARATATARPPPSRATAAWSRSSPPPRTSRAATRMASTTSMCGTPSRRPTHPCA